MAVTFVGKGLGLVASVIPSGVVTPSIFITPVETYRITTEGGEALRTETGDYIERHFYSLATAAGD